jgi:hypothetical protein
MTQNAIAGALRPPAASSAIRTRTTARCGAVARRAVLPLMRLHYAGSASTWGLAVCRASHDDYEKSLLPRLARWRPAGSPRLRLRPLSRRPHRLDHSAAPTN